MHTRLSRRRWELIALAAGGATFVALWAGWSATAAAIAGMHPAWLALTAVVAPVAVLGYAIAYRARGGEAIR